MRARVSYKASVEKDIRRLGGEVAFRILRRIEDTLAGNPAAGSPLAGEFKGMYRIRAGDYRVICGRVKGGILVLRIAHRKEAYR